MNIIVSQAWQIIFKGGPMMWPILLLSILGLAIGINRLLFLSAAQKRIQQQKKILFESLHEGDLKETLKLCESQQGVLPDMIKAAILKFGSSADMIRVSMLKVMEYHQSKLKNYMDMLQLIVNVAPMLGLLGTINAMTVVFHAAVVRSNVLSPMTAGELAAGIWQALITASAGLVVGIFCFSIYSFCASRINSILNDLNYLSVEVEEVLGQINAK